MKNQKTTAISNFASYKTVNLSSIYGGNGNGSEIGGDLEMNSNIKGGVLNAAIGKG
ncbi:hypothetical protein [uncultured Aquimarina sp.]|uniref:hypothetical protein n=1 Tax=uncultured Aquimarina sp. TaxID=575652 RepID=UPI00260CD041|nr:hypothetical protein [uncultured Aquimarina sp.]